MKKGRRQPLKTAGVREVRDHFSDYLSKSQEGPLLVMVRNQPAAIIQGVSGMSIEEIVKRLSEGQIVLANN